MGKLPPNVSAWLQGNPTSRLLKKVDAVLLVFDDTLYDLKNATYRVLTTDDDKSRQTAIAQAARELIGARAEKPSVLLLLPPQEFIATRVNMPGVTKESLRSALELQSSVLLPSYEFPLVFTFNTHPDPNDSHDVVIWSDETQLDLLFAELAAEGIFLVGVMPRNVAGAALSIKAGTVLLKDEDAHSVSTVLYQDGVLREYLQVKRPDLDDADFARQWQDSNSDLEARADISVKLLSANDYCTHISGEINHTDYSFIPHGARDALQQEEKGKRIIYGVAAAIILVLLVSSPFLFQSMQLMRLESELNNLQSASMQAREDQALVREFELSWGALNEFPRQHIPEVLVQLQTVLAPNVLTSLEIDEGSVEIEGESDDPQSLLQLLEQNSLFTGVDFARATNNNRYYIELRLSTVDYDAYRQWYFPDVRR